MSIPDNALFNKPKRFIKIYPPKKLKTMGLILYKESSKYSQFQVVTYENKQIILINHTLHIIPSVPHWNAWEIDHKGHIHDIDYYIKETHITGIVDIYDFLDIKADTFDTHTYLFDKEEVYSFTIHFYKLKLTHFLDDL